MPGANEMLPQDLRRLLLHNSKLGHTFYSQVQEQLTAVEGTGLDRAVSRIWSAFHSAANTWDFLGHLKGRWICKTSGSRLNVESQVVSYNILSGELLVNGRPLGLLPKDYTSHKTFVRLFGAQILRVSASDMAGMVYMTAAEEYGHKFYFCMRGQDLVIRAKYASTTAELIPHERFTNDFPNILVEDYTHWLDLDTRVVDFRPLTRKWVADAQNWRLVYRPEGESYLEVTKAKLVDIRSRTCQNAVNVIGGIEMKAFMHITRSIDGVFHVYLPRLGFHFFKNSNGDLECQELRKVVDRNQSIGTLFGLKNRLVLCAHGNRSKELDRIVLIPKGLVSTTRKEAHIVVRTTTSGRNVHCFRYQYDAILHRLQGDGSVASRLYQAYLHALTSYILPDPLTGYLGMEQSLKLLEEQISRCSKPLEIAEVDILNQIAALTPQRVFYPAHRQVMQQVVWNQDLSPLLQHIDFVALAEKILEYGEQFRMFHQDLQSISPVRSRGDEALLHRARIRNSTYMNVDFGGNEWTTDHDLKYESRDLEPPSDRLSRVYVMSSLVTHWRGDMSVHLELVPRWKRWGRVAGFKSVFDVSQPISDLLELDIASSWGSLYELCRLATREDSMYKLLFLFAQISFGAHMSSLDDMKLLLAFATNSSLHSSQPFPNYQDFNLGNGSTVDDYMLESAIKQNKKPYVVSRSNTSATELKQNYANYERQSAANVSTAVTFYANQWPCQRPAAITRSLVTWLNVEAIKEPVNKLFAEWYKNRSCEAHLKSVEGIIQSTMTSAVDYSYQQSAWHQTELIPRITSYKLLPTLPSLMASRSPHSPCLTSVFRADLEVKAPTKNLELRALITKFGTKPDMQDTPLRVQYKDELLASLDAFQDHEETTMPDKIRHSIKIRALGSFDNCEARHSKELGTLRDSLEPEVELHKMMKTAGLWPRSCLRSILRLIASSSGRSIPKAWKKVITTIGLGITTLQRARRLILAAEKDDVLFFHREIENPGQLGWNAEERPDWLLIEIENDFLIRPIQARVALEMIEPTSSSNTLMQLNMGEGKSSVITPLIAATLADTRQLVRVVVLRSLTRQMQDTLIHRLGGLVNRPVYFMPFSRETPLDGSVVRKMQRMYADCMSKRGVLISQPEHILSFKLMGIERVASGAYDVGRSLLETQAWLEKYCRDVLDESDEILDVKFQLIYTLGSQRSMDGQPDRWLMMQGVFDLIQYHAGLLREMYPEQIEVEDRTSGSFPTIRLLSTAIRRTLISKVGEDICSSRIPGLLMSNLPTRVRKAAASFIIDHDVTDNNCSTVQSFCTEDEKYLKRLLMARGLIACGILSHVLHDKRWSVNYGLHPTRCLCAVPYRAKGVPAATAEFGHPDVWIALTCLSYYYAGLKNDQIRLCLEILQKADDPSAEFGTWTKADKFFPRYLVHWNAVNLEDHQQCEEQLFPALRLNKKVADFYLSNVVFPKEGKEFDQKLSTSGWDIPARLQSIHVTTGFSGTNDNRFLLPSSILQRDLPELKHTSGKVLEFLSRPENLSYHCAKDSLGAQLSSEGLLQVIMSSDPSIRVLIDVGAQILDLSNEQVIARWLVLVHDADAGVYFDENDYAIVLTKAGKKEKLAASSFLNQMDRCIVYLDDVHTRGTDLKLPGAARAAVTLGPRLAKDRLVQACMRLRQLGHGQSLMFFASPEVHQDILKTTGLESSDDLNGLHVIEWSLEQSCLQIERNQPLRAVQGLGYYHRLEALKNLKQRLSTSGQADTEPLATAVVEHEAQSLQDLYSPEAMREDRDPDLVRSGRSNPDTAVQELVEIWDKLDPRISRGANMHEELEREIGHEVEQETHIERPSKATPEYPVVDPKLPEFIRMGTASVIKRFMTVWEGVLFASSSAPLSKIRGTTWKNLRVSNDFARTVKRDKLSSIDDYIRPANWVLVSKDRTFQNKLLFISQYEVNQCFDEIQDPSSRVILVIYEPRVTRAMSSIGSSSQHPLPGASGAWNNLSTIIRQELHLFAGQLYFSTFEEYEHVVKALAAGPGSETAAPLSFIREWIGIRRKGQNYLQTHIGQVASGRVLHKEMFETISDDMARADADGSAVE
ncbi:MAG: hypothetical protein Q9166_003242 [cf. Caloplaca sp. 2 TL-2023]